MRRPTLPTRSKPRSPTRGMGITKPPRSRDPAASPGTISITGGSADISASAPAATPSRRSGSGLGLEADKEASSTKAAQSGCALAAARKGWRAGQDHGRHPPAGEGGVAAAHARRETGAMTLSRRDLEEGRMRAVYMEAV